MYQKMIQQRTGHRSLKALRTYERTMEEQELAVSIVLTADKNIDYTDSLPSEQSKEWALTLQSPASTAEQPSNLAPGNHMLKQLCQVSQTQSFAPNLTSLFGSTTNCVINVNFGQSSTSVDFHGKKEFNYQFSDEMDRALSSIDFNYWLIECVHWLIVIDTDISIDLVVGILMLLPCIHGNSWPWYMAVIP